MDKNVKITLRTTQTQDGDSHRMKFSYEGMYYQKGNHCYVMYDEPVEGSKEVIKNRIKFSEQFVEVIKKGPLSSNMFFEKGKSHLTEYDTPFGKMLLEMETYYLQIEWKTENSMQLEMHYRMSNEQGLIADCKMKICVES